MLHDESISDSKLLPVGIAHHDTASGTSSRWGVSVISRGATSTSVNEKGTAAAHLTWFLWLKIEGTWTLNSFVHDVHTGSKFVCGGWKGTDVWDTLFGRVVISFSLAWVADGVDSVISWAASKPSCVLIVVIGHSWTSVQGSTAAFRAWSIAKVVWSVKDLVNEGDKLLSDSWLLKGSRERLGGDKNCTNNQQGSHLCRLIISLH